MKVVVQRVSEASVEINNSISAKIDNGFVLLLGFEESDSEVDIKWIVKKIVNLRLFSDTEGLMNLSVKDINGELLCISQFTLFASTKKGNRPSFVKAAKPEIALPLYNKAISIFKDELPNKIKTGQFGTDMKIQLVNDGPVTIIIDSKHKF